MSAGPQLQLAVLWPWLLVATLQVGLGHTGLALAVESERSAAQKAIIRVIPLKVEPITLEGVFANVAEVTPAEGKLLQFHPLSLCNTSEDEHTGSGFVTIVKLERPDRDLHPCLSLANKAKLAGERGARAILFDITDDESAADQLRKPRGLSQPVVLIRGHDAELLMGVVNKNREAHVKIEVKEQPAWPDYDVWILLTVLSTVIVIVLIFVARTKCHWNRTQDSLQQQTMQAISQLAIRKYQARCRQAALRDSASSCSSAPVCAICLEEFSEGQELRIISCSHEFHRECVDPWLQQHHTCPLCMFNIIEGAAFAQPAHLRQNSQDLEPGQRLHLFRQHPGYALYHLPEAHPQRRLRNFASQLPHGNPFFHSPELSQLDFSTMHYLPYRPVGSMATCSHQPSLAQGLGNEQHRKSPACGQMPSSHRTCPLQHQAHCLGFRTAAIPRQPHAAPLRRGISHGRQHISSGSGESYLTEHSGYLADGPGSDSSSGPCHGSSSDSMLNCTDVSLQGIHGSCSTFCSSLSSDYDPWVYCSSTDNGQEQLQPPGEPRTRSLDLKETGSTALAKSQILSHVHYHHHRHHHYRKDLECPSGRSGQEPSQRRPRFAGAVPGARTQKRTEKTRHCKQPLESSPGSQDASLSGQPSCVHQGPDLSKHLSSSADRSDFSRVASRQAGAAGPLPFPLSQKHGLQSRHHRRKRKCRPEPVLAHLSEDSDVHKDCNVHIHYGHSPGYCCSPEVQSLLPTAPMPYCSGSQVVWKCRVPPSNLKSQQQDKDLSEREGKPTYPGDFSGTGTAEDNTSLYLPCQTLQHNQGSKEEIQDVYEHSV
ncbi:E3 ubiquitin-protein ligase RNF43 [Mauremys reevesii]|uniref:E3 ubiquitin-protein ligase RNF43 n=1 Tax=Mauremys reevesii TaxID=260615 RepID=UPI00193F65FB|nr:E3 ubiquitin-protein ligase RNF43 [Mauremys reevesii]